MIWVDVPGFEGKYKVSPEGKVLSLNIYNNSWSEIKGTLDKDGYRIVVLCKNKKYLRKRVGRLVGQIFCDGYGENLTIDHKDGDKTNNHFSNLQWVTRGENTRLASSRNPLRRRDTHPNSKLSSRQVREILLLGKIRTKQRSIARMYGVTPPTICNILKRG